MPFASTELAARIERAECALLREAVAAVAEAHPEHGATILPLGGGVASWSGDGSPLNKVAGVGFAGALEPEPLAAVERFYAERGCSVQVELATLAHPGIAPMLTGRGYHLVGFENVLGLDPREDLPADRTPSGVPIQVVESGEEDFRVWLDTLVAGFLTPDGAGVPAHEEFARATLEEILGDLARAPGFVRYLAWVDGRPAGAASMRAVDGVAQLTGAATVPALRRRGVQAALLTRRLTDARRVDCDVATVTTQPGSTSHKNARRNGFELLYVRARLVATPAGEGGVE
ncbi:MAG: GNAT family N-acetyltransferase [Gemmatimonadetes bacterium]|nr:GNAT family N-acetyltransferase [Gemmatimonadota bacterium]